MGEHHVFLLRAGAAGLEAWDQRAEHASPDRGLVEEARYFRRRDRSFLQRLVPWLAPPRRATDMRFVLPFDERGRDVLALCEAQPWLEGDDDPSGSLRRVRGHIVGLEPRTQGDDVVLRDFWLEQPPVLRLVESIDFGVLPTSGPPVAVCCAMAPLVVARPSRLSVEAFAAELDQPASTLLLRHAGERVGETGSCVQLRQGEEVEVIGMVTEPRTSAKRFDVAGRSAPYRGAPRAIELIVGDEPGTRLVIRRI